MEIPQAPPKTSKSNPLGGCSGNLNFTFSQVYKPVPLSEGAGGAGAGVALPDRVIMRIH